MKCAPAGVWTLHVIWPTSRALRGAATLGQPWLNCCQGEPLHTISHLPDTNNRGWRVSQDCVFCFPHIFMLVIIILFFSPSGPFQPSDDTMLMFYSYYKQATVGPCNIPRPSGFWDSRGRIKWYMIFPTRAPGSSVRPHTVFWWQKCQIKMNLHQRSATSGWCLPPKAEVPSWNQPLLTSYRRLTKSVLLQPLLFCSIIILELQQISTQNSRKQLSGAFFFRHNLKKVCCSFFRLPAWTFRALDK